MWWQEARDRDRTNKAVRAQANEFVHSDIAVTADRLDRFARASSETQLATLATLRERAADNGATELAVVGVAAALLIALFVPATGLADWSTVHSVLDIVGRSAAEAILTFVVVVLVVFGAREWFQRDRRRELAIVWLAAYEDELTRRSTERAAPESSRPWFRRRMRRDRAAG